MPPRGPKTPLSRSENMSRIRSKDTKPEILVRQALHKLGFRFRLHVRNLPGRPDIVLPKHRTIIEIKGCFWHGHSCIDGRVPRSNQEYWVPKLLRNKVRDRSNVGKLRRLGWSVRLLWECKVCSMDRTELERFLAGLLAK
jgi:DNA mismatch endonuclease (patch repair protein)